MTSFMGTVFLSIPSHSSLFYDKDLVKLHRNYVFMKDICIICIP